LGNVTSSGFLATTDRVYIPGNRPISDWFSSSLTAGYSVANNYGWVNGAGNLVLGANGAERVRITANGLTFNGDTAAANALDDYEEGTWTPAYQSQSLNVSANYSYRSGTYTKIGNMVYAFFDMSATSISGTLSPAWITGLPFNISSTLAGYSVNQFRDASGVEAGPSNTILKGFAEQGQSYLFLQYDNTGSAGFATNSTTATWKSTGGRITGYVIYQV
jgi:hypothetical protein